MNCFMLDHACSQTYIFPVLKYGPNNQKKDLRQALALAKHTGSGIVLTGLYKHYWDLQNKFGLNTHSRGHPGPSCFGDARLGFMDFDRIFDRSALEQFVPVTTVRELKEDGWNGRIDVMVYSSNWLKKGARELSKALRASNVTMNSTAMQIRVDPLLKCKKHVIDKLTHHMHQSRVVAVMSVGVGMTDCPHVKTSRTGPPEDQCRADVFKAERALRASPWLVATARKYIAQYMGDKPYLAVHLRPYPDGCLQEWKKPTFNDTALSQKCATSLKDLHTQAACCVRSVMAAQNLTQVFVMTHPVIRPVVSQLFAKEGLQPIFFNASSLPGMAGCVDTSATFESLVEEQIAVWSTALLGTSLSTITQSITLERLSMNVTSNYFFGDVKCSQAEAA